VSWSPCAPPSKYCGRLPNCFRSFDQKPEDCAHLVERFIQRFPERTRSVLVVGVRTSGSYLAPLVVAYLRSAGYTAVDWLTYRPGQHPPRRRLRAAEVVLVVDDPPRTGGVLARTARELAVPVILLVPLFEDEPPEVLRGLDVVALPFREWAIHRLLPGAEAPPRGHVRARLDDGTYARGVGLGYFGRQVAAVAASLPELLPRVEDVRDGILYREWVDGEPPQRADSSVAHRIAGYVTARARALRVERDPTTWLIGRDAVWEDIALLLEQCYGRVRLAARPFARRAGKRFSVAREPSVIDGEVRVRSFVDGRKVDFEDKPFAASGLTVYSYDPFFDAAGAVANAAIERLEEDDFAAVLRADCQRELGPVSDERWLLYQVVHHKHARAAARGSLERILAIERATSRAAQLYFEARFFADVEPPSAGPLCAVDIDGVLETRLLTAPVIGPDGALALRALARHGFRAVLVTGRSLEELRERCCAYRLAGGAAEYGAAVLAAHEVRSLLDPADAERLAAVRAKLAEAAIDEAYSYSVRAYRREDGMRGPLLQQQVAHALVDGVTAIPGDLQTDFVAGPNKGDGLRALVERYESPVALAVGDSATDLPMFAVSEHAYAPAHARATLGAHARVTRRPYQAGLLEAVASFLGHDPRRCATCEAPAPTADTRLLLAALRAKDGGALTKLAQLVRLAKC
jgi:hypothetical protein